MIIWIVIGIVFVIVALYLMQLEHHTRRFKVIFLVIIGSLLLLSIMTVFRSDQVDTTSFSGIVSGVYLYIGYMGHAISNVWHIGVETTGKVIQAVSLNSS